MEVTLTGENKNIYFEFNDFSTTVGKVSRTVNYIDLLFTDVENDGYITLTFIDGTQYKLCLVSDYPTLSLSVTDIMPVEKVSNQEPTDIENLRFLISNLS